MKDTIWKKGDFFTVNTLPTLVRVDMDPSVVTLPRFEIPLTWGFSFDQPTMGKVTNIYLEDGEIFGELTFWQSDKEVQYEDLKEGHHVRLGGYYANVVQHGQVVQSCELRSVGIVMLAPYGANPGANIIPEQQ